MGKKSNRGSIWGELLTAVVEGVVEGLTAQAAAITNDKAVSAVLSMNPGEVATLVTDKGGYTLRRTYSRSWEITGPGVDRYVWHHGFAIGVHGITALPNMAWEPRALLGNARELVIGKRVI
jgi:hypothetical protein